MTLTFLLMHLPLSDLKAAKEKRTYLYHTRVWTTLEVLPDMDLGVVQGMCETTLLYLGNNLYPMLRQHLFSLKRPIPFDLEDMQMMRPLHQDLNERLMYFEMRIGSDYETLVQSDEVTPIPDKKSIPRRGSPHNS